MTRPSSTPPPASGPRTSELRSLGTLAAYLVTCRHPEGHRVSANVIVTERPVRITWCSICGALAADEGLGDAWQPSALASIAIKPYFDELSQILHAIRNAYAIAQAASPVLPDGASQRLLMHLRAALDDLLGTHLALDLDRLDDLIGRMPSAPHNPPF